MADAEEDLVGEDVEASEGDKKAAQAALHYTIGHIAEEEFPDGQISRLSVAALTELTMGYMGMTAYMWYCGAPVLMATAETFAHDLENFAAHAGRRKINVEEYVQLFLTYHLSNLSVRRQREAHGSSQSNGDECDLKGGGRAGC